MSDHPKVKRPAKRIASNQPGTMRQQLHVVRLYLADPDPDRAAAYQRARRRVLAHARRAK